jgi:hypothetical protein
MAATVTLYLFLTAITLMGTEGWVAYQAVVRSFNGLKVSMWKLLAVAYGIPIPIIAATWVTSHLNKDEAFGGPEL